MTLPSNDRVFFLRSIAGLVSVVLTTVIRCAAGAILHLLMVWMLLPEEFGVYAFALLCAHAFIALSHLGVKKFVVQTESEHAIADALKVQCMLSWIVWGVAMLSANSVGAFIGSQQGTLLFRVFATQLLFLPITFSYQGIAERDARHDLSQRANRLGIYAELVIGVIALRLGYGALGVAVAITCRSLIEAATLVITLGPRHLRLGSSRLDMAHAKTFLKFGLPMLASGFLVFGYWNVDDIFVGRILGEEQLGYYAFAFRFPHYLSLLSAALVTVSLPVLARLRHDNTQTERVFAALTRVTAYGMGLCAIVCLLYGEQLIQLIFGDAWLPALVPFQIFVAVVACRNIAIYWTTLHESRGITRYQMVATPFNLVSIIVLSLLLIHSMGITGVAIAVAVTMLVSLVFFVPWFVRKVLPGFSYIRVLSLPLALGGLWCLCGAVMHRYLPASFWPLGLCLLALGFCMSVAVLDRKLMSDLLAVWSMRKAD